MAMILVRDVVVQDCARDAVQVVRSAASRVVALPVSGDEPGDGVGPEVEWVRG